MPKMQWNGDVRSLANERSRSPKRPTGATCLSPMLFSLCLGRRRESWCWVRRVRSHALYFGSTALPAVRIQDGVQDYFCRLDAYPPRQTERHWPLPRTQGIHEHVADDRTFV